MTTPPFARSACAALLTLFDEDGHLLVERTAELATTLLEDGAEGFLVAGSAGEFWMLEDAERIELVAAVRKAIPEAVPVLAHVGGTDQSRLASLTKSSIDAGADAVLALAVGVEDLQAYYAALVGAAGGAPALAYHLPAFGSRIPIDQLADLGVTGIKDSSGDVGRFCSEVLRLPLDTYTGSPALLNLGRQLGAAGAITGVANLRPSWCAAAWQGDGQAQCEICRLYLATGTSFPRGLKKAATERWGTPPHSRPLATPRTGT
jgi:4-hydroxy-tetrahydrodipicolinate synthase